MTVSNSLEPSEYLSMHSGDSINYVVFGSAPALLLVPELVSFKPASLFIQHSTSRHLNPESKCTLFRIVPTRNQKVFYQFSKLKLKFHDFSISNTRSNSYIIWPGQSGFESNENEMHPVVSTK